MSGTTTTTGCSPPWARRRSAAITTCPSADDEGRPAMLGNQPVTVVVQHQNVMIRELLTTHLSAEPGITVAGAVASGPDLIQLCHLCRPDVAMFEADGLRWSNERLVELLLEQAPQLRLVGLHDSLTASYVVKACAAGVSAMISYSR